MNQSFRVHVADRQTGQEEIRHFIAETPDAAGEKANEKGWLVRKVEPEFGSHGVSGHPSAHRTVTELSPAELRSLICWGIVMAWLVISLAVSVLWFLIWLVSGGLEG